LSKNLFLVNQIHPELKIFKFFTFNTKDMPKLSMELRKKIREMQESRMSRSWGKRGVYGNKL